MKIQRIAIAILAMSGMISIALGEIARANKQELSCMNCHAGTINQPQSHYIESDDDCMFCHDVAWEGAAHSVATVADNSSCVACHVAQDQLNSENIHSDQQCSSCHNPHGSSNDFMFVSSANNLCNSTCHTDGDIGVSHPVGENTVDQHTGGEMTCVSSCHSLHQPKEPKLLQWSNIDLCFQCHVDKY